jgi:DNA-binding NarL/FixJ family response regulator
MRAIIVDDHALIRTGLTDILQLEFPDIDILEANNSRTAMELLAANEVDLAIVDLFIPGEENFAFIRQLCDSYPALTVVVLSASENPTYIRKCIDLGASGFIPKSLPRQQLLGALGEVLAGKIFLPTTVNYAMPAAIAARGSAAPGVTREQVIACLTPRQYEILQLLAQGQSNKQIARGCQLSENTIKVHVSAILRALDLSNRTQAGILMQQLQDPNPVENA